ncbi:hypothetical protein WT88_29385 [Burkholderia stagnalis]|uniref:DUF4031 domain-containing protein n=1 Tax=Burkholderia stagnalis TaxID=1503054 RepID=UPI00075DCA7E|nr:DUF4031 domain-containing protein [Burkholderia stagnalis]KVZ18598.1 hypothetical protein WT35_04325 [Burkholderia stagnalis]KWN32821.1 hypothetical protein WT86_18450 [Burkholderia stagnalis]KWN44648.1 hypothetical protein WT88_29385 [Burkholderia stagnalis]KWN54381.1 hypothetical protein WT87_03480 [Burkholderia stagnalis]KWO68788.1 hypothetical protein WT99_20850 [Burkholderia stagnalis]
MAVYIDDMRARFGRMVMCHMLADTDAELHAMADKIGVARRWHQAPPRHDSHYDIALSKRALAVAAGAIEITWRQAGAMAMRRRVTGELGRPDDAVEWQRDRIAARREGEKIQEEKAR